MKEEFAYSKRMFEERTRKPARRKLTRELITGGAFVAFYVARAVYPVFADWMFDHAAVIFLAGVIGWGVWQMGNGQSA